MGSLSWLCNSCHNFVCPVEKSFSAPEHVRRSVTDGSDAPSREGAFLILPNELRCCPSAPTPSGWKAGARGL